MKATDSFVEKRTVHTVRDFAGINSSSSACDGDIIEAYNISTENYPAISSALPHTLELSFIGDSNSVVGCTDKIFYSTGTEFVYDGIAKGSLSNGRKNFCTLNGFVCIFPDRKYYHRKRTVYRPRDNALVECDTNEQFDYLIKIIAISETAPKNAKNGNIYYNSETDYLYTYKDGEWTRTAKPSQLQRYYIESEEFDQLDAQFTWMANGDEYYKVKSTDDGADIKFEFIGDYDAAHGDFNGLKVGDVVTVTGVKLNTGMSQDVAEGLSEGTVISDIGKGYITVKNTINAEVGGTNMSDVLRIKRFVPQMTCVATVGNRLWGAYGQTIYASAENNPLLWSKKNSLSDQTVAIHTGISDNIIACASLGDIPIFFTESSIIKVLKVYDGYKLSITPAISVSPENINSIANVSDSLYYVSSRGIMCYKGTVPVKINANINLKYSNIVGGSDGARYFVSDDTNTYIYDPQTKLWACESMSHYSFARYGSKLLATGKYYSHVGIFRIMSKHDIFSYEFAHYPGNAQILFAPFYENTHLKKTFSKLIIGTCTEETTISDVYVSFDGQPFVFAGCIKNKTGINVSEIPLVPVRADYMQVKIVSHSGQFDLLSLSREFVTHENYN